MAAKTPFLVPVGGFLGSGKTTLLIAAARILKEAGQRVGIVFNDQSSELVDTAWAHSLGAESREVAGGCFCCRFSDFIGAADALPEMDVIFAEPAGSCLDLSATILQPLKRDFAGRFRLAPLTVLVDPGSIDAIRQDADMRFLFDGQLAEADLVAFSKCDQYETFPELPGVRARKLSARTGVGVRAWLDEIFGGSVPAGQRILEVDYRRYAEAEAALAWLNCSFTVKTVPPLPPALVVGPFLDRLEAALTGQGARIAHVKVVDHCATGYLKAALTANGQEPTVEGDLTASGAPRHEVILNLRAVGEPAAIQAIVERSLPGRAAVSHMRAFRPAPPKPERRVPAVV